MPPTYVVPHPLSRPVIIHKVVTPYIVYSRSPSSRIKTGYTLHIVTPKIVPFALPSILYVFVVRLGCRGYILGSKASMRFRSQHVFLGRSGLAPHG